MSDGIWFQETSRSTTIDRLEIREVDTLTEAAYILDSVKQLLHEKNTAYGD